VRIKINLLKKVGGKGRFFVRPYAEKFLKEMAELYEVVVFTAGVKDVMNYFKLLFDSF